MRAFAVCRAIKNAMNIVELYVRSSAAVEKLTTLWRESVAATHTFLSAREIDEIEPDVRAGLRSVETLVVAADDCGEFCAFMGIENRRLEMLFVAPSMLGKGIGHRLVEYGIGKYRVDSLTVNEQNPRAVGFYEHLGFKVCKRTDFDEQNRPYPLLYMKM